MLLPQQVEINTRTKIRSLCRITDFRHFIVQTLSLSIPQLKDWVPLVMKIQPQCSFPLPVVAQYHLSCSHQVERQLEASHDGYTVLLEAEQFLSISR